MNIKSIVLASAALAASSSLVAATKRAGASVIETHGSHVARAQIRG